MIWLYVFLNNNVVVKENVHEDDRKPAKIPVMIYYAKSNDCKLQIHPWQNEHQWSVRKFWSCKLDI
jgi:hypothetical protein